MVFIALFTKYMKLDFFENSDFSISPRTEFKNKK